jgi:hypothetical protein
MRTPRGGSGTVFVVYVVYYETNCGRFHKIFFIFFFPFSFYSSNVPCSRAHWNFLASVVKWKMCDLKKSKNTKINEYVTFPIFKKGGLPSVLWKRLVI